MKKSLFGIVVASAFFVGITSTANAALWQFDVNIDGLQEVPPVATPGFGTAQAIFNDVSGEMTITGTFSSLIGTSNNAHLHGYANPGINAGVVFGLTFDVGVTSGNISGNGIIPAGRIADTLNGLTYINIHSTFRPGGEIRGQLIDPVLVPEPATVTLFGLGAFAVLRRRR